MLTSSVEKLFERYRRRGDAGALARVFDATAPELFRLAQHLVRDPLEAEDVLQDTYVAAIDAADRWDAARPLVPWLTGILARKASESRRKARRPLELDRLTERAEADPADLVAESELSVEIVQAIEALPELYRAVLLRHLLDGAKPAEIARDLGRAPGTVRMQIHRGLEQLRKTLPAGFAAGAVLAAFSPRGLAAVKAAVMTHAATVAAAGGAVASVTAVQATSFALAKFLGGGLIAALIAVGAYVIWRVQSHGTLQPAAPRAGELDVAGAPGDALATPRPAVAVVAGEPGASATPREPRVRLVGTVTGVDADGLADTTIEVRGIARYPWPQEHTLKGHPRADGRFEIVLDPLFAFAGQRGPLSALAVRAVHKAYLAGNALIDLASATPAEASASDGVGFELACTLDLRPAALVSGEVRDANGPRAGVEVLLARVLEGALRPGEVDRALSDAQGRYVLQAGEAGAYEVLALAPGFAPAHAPVAVRGALPVDVPALALEAGRTLRGRVTDGGSPVAAAQLECRPAAREGWVQLAGQLLLQSGDELSWGLVRATSDEEGRFALSGLAWVPCTLDVPALADGLRYLREGPALEVDVDAETVEVELASARVELELLDAEGAPLSGEVAWSVASPTSAPSSAEAVEGRLELAVASGLRLPLELRAPAHEPATRDVGPLEKGELRRERVVLASDARSSALALDVSTRGTTLEYVTARLGSGQGTTRRLEVEDGRALLEDLPTGTRELELYANGAWRHYEDDLLPSRMVLDLGSRTFASRHVDFQLGGRLRLSVKDLAGQFLPARCTLRDLYGAEQDVRFLLRSPDEQRLAPGERLSDRGPSDVYPNLAPGVYEVELAMEGRERRVQAVQVRAGEVTELEVVLP